MEIREQSLNFPETSGSGPQPAEATISFPRAVLRAAAGINGYSATFGDEDDHELGRLIVEVNSEINPDNPNEVIVRGSFGLRDWSGEWDDRYSGNIQYVLLAELEPIVTPAPGDPRGDLIIVDAEVTQAIQHFRSHEHLDSPNVFPDNSIGLVADKPTAVRLYVDYDAASGLPLINQLSGSLDVVSGTTTTTLAPLASIRPRRDVSIDRGQTEHTLNFVIPEDVCRGTVTLSARVADRFDATQFSTLFEREVQFDQVPAVPVMAVGIEYTGPDTNDDATDETLAAPVESDFTDVLDFTERVYPIPGVEITSYTTMTYDEEIESEINAGCDKFDDLRDAVAEMRGDSEDIVYGMLNSGVNTGSVGGCGGDGVGVGKIGNGTTAAHEIGHALGRQHAPCDNITRCASPRNTDDGFPSYSGYDSDSIGEYGFNLDNGRVVDPSIAHDMMGYSGSKWISPYTYKALRSRIPEIDDGDAGGGAAALAVSSSRSRDRGEWIKKKSSHLFLRLRIHRDRSVHFQPAFHYAVFPQGHGNLPTDFVVELHDEHGDVLRSACLYAGGHDTCCACSCEGRSGRCSWPLVIRQAVPFDHRAKKLVLYECDTLIHDASIPEPPDVKVRCEGARNTNATDLALSWSTAKPSDSAGGLWYLVQWRDAHGTWRGGAPRTQATSLQVPKTLFGRQQEAAVRVLATSGIATGQGLWQGSIRRPRRPRTADGNLRIFLTGASKPTTKTQALPSIIRVAAVDDDGSSLARPAVRWYDSRGGELGRGRSLDLRTLPVGAHTVRVAILNTGYGTGTVQWLLERTAGGQFLLHRGTLKRRRE